jgi:predicted RNA-binding protein YlqC (UPF0109 family)
MEPTELIKKLLKTLARATANPLVSESAKCQSEIQIQVDKQDQGRVIGKRGITIAALSVVMWHIGEARLGTPIKLTLLEPDSPNNSIPVPYMPTVKLDTEELREFTEAILKSVCKSYELSITPNTGGATVIISLPEKEQSRLSDPNFEAALEHLVITAGKCCGGVVTPEIIYNAK